MRFAIQGFMTAISTLRMSTLVSNEAGNFVERMSCGVENSALEEKRGEREGEADLVLLVFEAGVLVG